MSDLRFQISQSCAQGRGRQPVRVQRGRSGFSFTEVLFAVMILGIGFIMVAAIFPVAIRQSQANLEDSIGATVAQTGARIMEASGVASGVTIQEADGRVHPFRNDTTRVDDLYDRIKGSLIVKSDPRFAWAPLGYKLSRRVVDEHNLFLGAERMPSSQNPTGSSYVDVYIVALQARHRSAFTDASTSSNDTPDTEGVTFQSKEVYFYLHEGGIGNPDTITFTGPGQGYLAAADGAYVVVADDRVQDDPSTPENEEGRANGRMYRLGVKRDDLGPLVWELAPGNDMTYTAGPDGQFGTVDDYNENLPPRRVGQSPSGDPAIGLMFGRAYSDPGNPRSALEGEAQDLFATTIRIHYPTFSR